MNTQDIESFLQEIRRCRDCGIKPQGMPFVFGSSNSRILVVSEMPSKTAWERRDGEKWGRGEIGLPRYCEQDWLDIGIDEFKSNFFWTHTANCYTESRAHHEHCSSKFLSRAIGLVNPKMILIFGRTASEHFFPNKKMKFLVNKELTCAVSGKKYDCHVLFHWSKANEKWRKKFRKIHRNAIEDSKKIIEQIIH